MGDGLQDCAADLHQTTLQRSVFMKIYESKGEQGNGVLGVENRLLQGSLGHWLDELMKATRASTCLTQPNHLPLLYSVLGAHSINSIYGRPVHSVSTMFALPHGSVPCVGNLRATAMGCGSVWSGDVRAGTGAGYLIIT
jgi:hypothetical protein